MHNGNTNEIGEEESVLEVKKRTNEEAIDAMSFSLQIAPGAHFCLMK
jgi:hypothetical protein